MMAAIICSVMSTDISQMAAWIPDMKIQFVNYRDFTLLDESMREQQSFDNLAKISNAVTAYLPRMIYEGASAILEVQPYDTEFIPETEAPETDNKRRVIPGKGFRTFYSGGIRLNGVSYVARSVNTDLYIIDCDDAPELINRALAAGVAVETGEKALGRKIYSWKIDDREFGMTDIVAALTPDGLILVAPTQEMLRSMLTAGMNGTGIDTDSAGFRSIQEFLPELPGNWSWRDVKLPWKAQIDFRIEQQDNAASIERLVRHVDAMEHYRLRSSFSQRVQGEDQSVTVTIRIFDTEEAAEKYTREYKDNNLFVASRMNAPTEAQKMVQERLAHTTIEWRGTAAILTEAHTEKGQQLYEEFVKAANAKKEQERKEQAPKIK